MTSSFGNFIFCFILLNFLLVGFVFFIEPVRWRSNSRSESTSRRRDRSTSSDSSGLASLISTRRLRSRSVGNGLDERDLSGVSSWWRWTLGLETKSRRTRSRLDYLRLDLVRVDEQRVLGSDAADLGFHACYVDLQLTCQFGSRLQTCQLALCRSQPLFEYQSTLVRLIVIFLSFKNTFNLGLLVLNKASEGGFIQGGQFLFIYLQP